MTSFYVDSAAGFSYCPNHTARGNTETEDWMGNKRIDRKSIMAGAIVIVGIPLGLAALYLIAVVLGLGLLDILNHIMGGKA